jgi:hypothetical protein
MLFHLDLLACTNSSMLPCNVAVENINASTRSLLLTPVQPKGSNLPMLAAQMADGSVQYNRAGRKLLESRSAPEGSFKLLQRTNNKQWAYCTVQPGDLLECNMTVTAPEATRWMMHSKKVSAVDTKQWLGVTANFTAFGVLAPSNGNQGLEFAVSPVGEPCTVLETVHVILMMAGMHGSHGVAW